MDVSLYDRRSTGITGRVRCVGSPSTVSSHFRVFGTLAGCLTDYKMARAVEAGFPGAISQFSPRVQVIRGDRHGLPDPKNSRLLMSLNVVRRTRHRLLLRLCST